MVLIKILSDADGGKSVNVSSLTTTSEVKKIIAETVKEKQKDVEYDIYYLGKELRENDKALSTYGNISEKSILFALPKPRLNLAVTEPPSLADIDRLLSSVQATFSENAQRSMLIKIASNPETLQNLIDCIPGLRQDSVAQAVLMDPYLLIHWINAENATENFKSHPCLFAACQQLVEHLHTDLLRNNGVPPAAAYDTGIDGVGPYSSDEEDDENQGGSVAGSASSQQVAHSAPASRLHITPQYLAAALAAATAAGRSSTPSLSIGSSAVTPVAPPSTPRFSESSYPNSNINPGSSVPQHAPLTTEMLQQAMSQAFAPATSRSTTIAPTSTIQPNVSMENYEAQMYELTSMGFVEREENLVALRHSRGDVQGALEFIINERERWESSMGLD